jgi:polyvinyl alcohol dehydrogenase (cytochrome)
MSITMFGKLSIVMATALSLAACQKTGDGPDGGSSETLQSTEQFATGDGLIADRDSLPGAKLFEENCASCHLGGVAKAPHLQWLEMMPPAAIVNALTGGVMAEQGKALDEQGKLHIAEYITRQSMANGLPKLTYAPKCDASKAGFDRAKGIPKVGWGHDSKRFVPENIGGVTADNIDDLELKWTYAFPSSTRARSQPTIAMGAVFVGGEDGRVMALDLETGCEKWAFEAAAEVRSGIVIADDAAPKAFFGDLLGKVYAVDALTGKLLWSLRADDHPSTTITATPLYHDGKILFPVSSLEVVPAADPSYPCCTFRGLTLALDAQSGDEIWRFYPIPGEPKNLGKNSAGADMFAPSGAPMWISPTVDTKRNLVYLGSGENYSSPADNNSDAIFAVDIDTGKRVWQRQTISGDAWNVACMMEDNPNCPKENGPDFDHSSSILLIDLSGGKQILVAGHKNGNVYGLDPDAKGKLLWTTKVGRGSIQGGIHFGMAAQGTTVYAPVNDMNNTRNGQTLDPSKARPGMHAIDVTTGKKKWGAVQKNICGENRPFCDPGISAAVTAIPGAVIAGHMDGHIRAYARDSGKLLWDFNSAREFKAINGMKARGGGMSGPGAAVGDGYVGINSGYGLYFHEAGNVFLMFGPKKS